MSSPVLFAVEYRSPMSAFWEVALDDDDRPLIDLSIDNAFELKRLAEIEEEEAAAEFGLVPGQYRVSRYFREDTE